MKKNIFAILAMGAMLLASCADELEVGTKLYEEDSEDYTSLKVFINETSNDNVHLTQYDSTPLFVTVPEDTASFFVRLNMVSEKDVVIKASLSGLPDGTYKFERDQVTIKAGSKVSDEDIRLVLVENDALRNFDEYTDAIVNIEVVSGEATVGKTMNSFKWTLRNRYTIIYLGEIDGLESKQYKGGDDWTPYSSSSYIDRFYDGIYTSYIYLTTSPTANEPSMYVEMFGKTQIEGIGFVPYGSSSTYLTRYWPGEAEFYISDNGEQWTSVGVIQFNVGEAATWQVVRFYEPVYAKYIGCKFNRNIGNYYSSIYFSEVGVFGEQSLNTFVITPEEPNVRVGKTIQLQASKHPVNAPESVNFVWASSDNSIATVDQDGNVTGVSEGVVQISVSSNGITSKVNVVVRSSGAQEFFGNYTMFASTSSSTTSTPVERKIEILKADDSHVTFRFADESQKRVINGRDVWLIAKLPFEKIDDDHYRIVWKAGTIFATDFLTASELAVPKVYACMYRGTGTSATYRSIADTSVDLDFAYDEASGKFKASFGETHDWSYVASGIGLAYDYINSSGTQYTNQSWLVMWGGVNFSLTRD